MGSPGFVLVRFFAAARSAAGTAEQRVPLDGVSAPERTVDQALQAALRELPEDRREPTMQILAACSLLLDETAVRDRQAAIHEGAVLDVLPPFAGG